VREDAGSPAVTFRAVLFPPLARARTIAAKAARARTWAGVAGAGAFRRFFVFAVGAGFGFALGAGFAFAGAFALARLRAGLRLLVFFTGLTLDVRPPHYKDLFYPQNLGKKPLADPGQKNAQGKCCGQNPYHVRHVPA